MTHSLASLHKEPSAASEIRFVSGPSLFVSTVNWSTVVTLLRTYPDGVTSLRSVDQIRTARSGYRAPY
jgi:hypothetical protein